MSCGKALTCGCADFVQSVQRALDQDLNREQRYPAAFRRNKGGKVIIDRAFNTAKLIAMYNPDAGLLDHISWNPDDPNLLKIFLPGMHPPSGCPHP